MSGSDALVARLQACGILSEGEIGSASLAGVYAPDGCYQQCLADATCDRLEAAICRSSLDLLVTCDQRCAFPCGDGSLVGVERRCDGFAQCADGADEAGCPGRAMLTCADGTRVIGTRCDYAWNCTDGSDEIGCPRVRCDGGREVYEWERCDGYRSCSDGADEAGCPQYTCESGVRITYREGGDPRCDGWSQCGDNSDEEGCARLMPMCPGL